MSGIAPPAVPVFPAGYGPLDTDFDSWVQVPFTFLTDRITCRVNCQSSQNFTSGVTSGASTIIHFDTVLEDSYSAWSNSNHRFTAPFSGWYQVTVFSSIQTAPVNLQVTVLVSGNSQFSTSAHQLEGSTLGIIGGGCATATVYCDGVDDFIQGQTIITGGVNVTNDVSSRGRYPRMEIVYVSQ